MMECIKMYKNVITCKTWVYKQGAVEKFASPALPPQRIPPCQCSQGATLGTALPESAEREASWGWVWFPTAEALRRSTQAQSWLRPFPLQGRQQCLRSLDKLGNSNEMQIAQIGICAWRASAFSKWNEEGVSTGKNKEFWCQVKVVEMEGQVGQADKGLSQRGKCHKPTERCNPENWAVVA